MSHNSDQIASSCTIPDLIHNPTQPNLEQMQITELKKKYLEWTTQSIKQMQKNAISNVTQRIPVMLSVVNNKLKSSFHSQMIKSDSDYSPLTLSNSEQTHILKCVHAEIERWTGIEVGSCKTEKCEFNEYANTARNWFNRNKAKIYGNHVFYPIVFKKIYQFLLNLKKRFDRTDNDIVVLFFDIIEAILHSTIQFRRSKAHPLIPHQTFIQPNLFRRACNDLCKHYGINWDLSLKKQKRRILLPNGSYLKNRHRSSDINKAFVEKIDEIKRKLAHPECSLNLPMFPDYQHYDTNNNAVHSDYALTTCISSNTTNTACDNNIPFLSEVTDDDDDEYDQNDHGGDNKVSAPHLSSNNRKNDVNTDNTGLSFTEQLLIDSLVKMSNIQSGLNGVSNGSHHNVSLNNHNIIMNNQYNRQNALFAATTTNLVHATAVSPSIPVSFARLPRHPFVTQNHAQLNTYVNSTANHGHGMNGMIVNGVNRVHGIHGIHGYGPTHCSPQNVSSLRHSPITKISINPTGNGRVTVCLHNVHQSQASNVINRALGLN